MDLSQPVYYFVIFGLYFQVSWGAAIPHDNLSIVGGNEVRIEDVPYVAALFYDGDFFCGGSIIHEQYILTAAHCVYKLEPDSIQVLIGSDRLNDGGVFVGVEMIRPHESYNNKSKYNDIALLKLKQQVDDSFWIMAAIQLPADARYILDGTMVNVTGWGLTEGDSGGPLTYEGIQIGIVSIGKDCGCNPGVYTRVASYLLWIDNIIGGAI